MKKVVIISYYKWWNNRQKYFYDYYKERGYDVCYIVSDYDHIAKKYRDEENIPKDSVKIHAPSYKKNFSIKRIISNFIFSKRVYSNIKNISPDIIICIVPTNFLGLALSKYKKINKGVIIITDVIDVWPETLPIKKLFKLILNPILHFWKLLRRKAINVSNKVILECNYYHKVLKREMMSEYDVLYLCKEKKLLSISKEYDEDSISFLYLGSINNIIDIKTIVRLLSLVNKEKKVKLLIIGCGTSQDVFIEEAKRCNIDVTFFGPIYDEQRKSQIMNKCNYGLNIFKKDVFVGLTTKSIDYFSNGLPIINNIICDTEDLVNRYNAGINIDLDDLDKTAQNILNVSKDDYKNMCYGVKELYNQEFYVDVFKKKLGRVLGDI